MSVIKSAFGSGIFVFFGGFRRRLSEIQNGRQVSGQRRTHGGQRSNPARRQVLRDADDLRIWCSRPCTSLTGTTLIELNGPARVARPAGRPRPRQAGNGRATTIRSVVGLAEVGLNRPAIVR